MKTTPGYGLPYLEPTDLIEQLPGQTKSVAEGLEAAISRDEFRGPQGDPGPQGIPGADAVPADDAVAAYLTAEDSATRTALPAALRQAIAGMVTTQVLALTDTTNFAVFSTGQDPTLTIGLDTIHLRGSLRLLTAGYIDGTTSRIWASIPIEARPVINEVFVCQGSGDNRWCLTVQANGDLVAARYGVEAPTANAWLPFAVSWPRVLS